MNNLAHIYNEGGGCDCAVAETLFSARGASGEAGVVPVRVHPFDPARSALWVTEDGGPCRSPPPANLMAARTAREWHLCLCP